MKFYIHISVRGAPRTESLAYMQASLPGFPDPSLWERDPWPWFESPLSEKKVRETILQGLEGLEGCFWTSTTRGRFASDDEDEENVVDVGAPDPFARAKEARRQRRLHEETPLARWVVGKLQRLATLSWHDDFEEVLKVLEVQYEGGDTNEFRTLCQKVAGGEIPKGPAEHLESRKAK